MRVVEQLDIAEPHARPRVHVHNNVHLVSFRVRPAFRRCFCLIQPFIPQRIRKPAERVLDIRCPVRLPQRQLHRRHRGRFRGRRFQPFNDHSIDGQIFPHYEIEPRTTFFARHFSAQISVITGLVKSPQARRHLVAAHGLSEFHGQAAGVRVQYFAVFTHNSCGYHDRG